MARAGTVLPAMGLGSPVKRAAFERAYDAIVDLIVRQELRPGEATSVMALSQRLGIGRTPTKEAITRLSTEGLLTVKGRRGTYVTRLNEQDVRHLFALRKLFEEHAAFSAAQRITDAQLAELEQILERMRKESLEEPRSLPQFVSSDVKFHNIIIEAAGNPYLLAQYRNLHLHQLIITYLFNSNLRSAERRQGEHVAIVEALKRRDGEALCRALGEHASNVEAAIIGSMREMRGEFDGEELSRRSFGV